MWWGDFWEVGRPLRFHKPRVCWNAIYWMKKCLIGKTEMWVNALLVGSVEDLEKQIQTVLVEGSADLSIKLEELESFSRTPGYPKPTYRLP